MDRRNGTDKDQGKNDRDDRHDRSLIGFGAKFQIGATITSHKGDDHASITKLAAPAAK